MTMPIDVPAQVQYDHFVENNVQVHGGNNWDFSRRARVTPIGPYVEAPAADTPVAAANEAQSVRPAGSADASAANPQRLAVIEFVPEEITLGEFARSVLEQLPKDTPLLVTAQAVEVESDAGRLAQTRAQAVATFLRSKGHDVQGAKVLGGGSGSDARGPQVQVYSAEDPL